MLVNAWTWGETSLYCAFVVQLQDLVPRWLLGKSC